MEREGKTRETSSRTVCLVVTRAAGEIGHAVFGRVLSAARVTALNDTDPGNEKPAYAVKDQATVCRHWQSPSDMV